MAEDAEMAEEPTATEEAAEGAEESKDAEPEAREAEPEAKEDGQEAKEDGQEAEAEAGAEAPAEPEAPKEREEDAAEDSRARLQAGVAAISAADSTLNVLPVAGGRLLMSLSEGGCQYLLAGARATVGIKTGRYMFEVRIVESLSPTEAQGSQGRTPQPRQLVRVGVSTAGSSLFLSDGPENVGFDSEGYFIYERSRKKVSQKFTRDQTVALLVNLDPKSPNANTISVFRNGARISEPQALPERLHGKVLYPTVTYKNVSLQVNFGPAPQAPLPFKCHMVASAAQQDVEVSARPALKDGKHEVLLPVGLPEQGYFDWVDSFLEKNPDYVELSDRKILEWATKSGLWRTKTAQSGPGTNDKPDMKFGIPMMDDLSVRKVINAVAPTQCRNYIIPELKSNLLPSERTEALARFSGLEFRKTATVIVGEPDAEYKEKVQSLMLADKKVKADAERKKRAQEGERKRLLEEKKKKAEEARRAKEAAQKRKEGKEVKEEKPEAPKDEEKKEEAQEEEEAPLALTEEEKAMLYRKTDAPDLDEKTLSKAYAGFSLPKAEEGFDAVTYAWQSEAASAELLKTWVLARKKTQKVEDLQPGADFKELWSKWTKTIQEWRKIQTEYKDPAKRKALLARRKEEAKKRKTEAGEGEEKAEEKEEEKPKEIDVDELDVFAVEDVTDIGNGEPLFQHFVYEDWALLSIRYELHLLVHSFKKDLDDPDRAGFTEEHMPFYYSKYFKKSFSLKLFAVEKFNDFLELIKETVNISATTSFIETMFDLDTPHSNFVKITEDHRRERQRRIDAGDETAKLKFNRPAPPPPRQAVASSQSGSARPASGASRPASGASRPASGASRPASSAAAPRTSSSYGARPASSGHRDSRGGARNGSGSGSYNVPKASGTSSSQKRPYGSSAPASSWGGGGGSSKYARASYSGGGSYGGGGGGGGGYYRR